MAGEACSICTFPSLASIPQKPALCLTHRRVSRQTEEGHAGKRVLPFERLIQKIMGDSSYSYRYVLYGDKTAYHVN